MVPVTYTSADVPSKAAGMMSLAQVLDEGLRRLAGGVAGQHRGEEGQVAGLVGGDLHGGEAPVGLHRRLEAADRLLDVRRGSLAVDHDHQRVGLAE